MSEMKKSYYAVIPANVRYDKRLTPNAKLLYGEITALCNEKGFCWAKNKYFADLYEVSKTSISKWINQLKKYDYLSIDIEYSDNKEILNRYIRIVKGGIQEKFNHPIKEKLKDNSTMINNTNNITMNNINDDLVNEIYKLYPSRCIIKNRSTGKGYKNKEQIKRLLKKGINLKKIINRYISECRNSKTYMMNFKTFLNNLPDYSEVTEYKKPNIEYDETDYLDRMADEGLKKVNETLGRKSAV